MSCQCQDIKESKTVEANRHQNPVSELGIGEKDKLRYRVQLPTWAPKLVGWSWVKKQQEQTRNLGGDILYESINKLLIGSDGWNTFSLKAWCLLSQQTTQLKGSLLHFSGTACRIKSGRIEGVYKAKERRGIMKKDLFNYYLSVIPSLLNSLVVQMVRIYLQCWWPGFDPWVVKIPWRRAWQPTPVFLPRESHGQRSLAGYSLWGCKESDTTERLLPKWCIW